jgi:hypothetical protein
MYIGVATHKHTHTLAAIDEYGRSRETRTIANSPEGWASGLVASSPGARSGRGGQLGPYEQWGSCWLAAYAAWSIPRISASRAQNWSRWSRSGTTSFSLVRGRK